MRVLFYSQSIDTSTAGGMGVSIQVNAVELGRIVDLHIATSSNIADLNLPTIKFHHISGNTLGFGLKRDWNRLLDEVKPDIVHVNGCWHPCISLVQRWSQNKGYKVVLTPHGMLEPWIIQRHYWTRKFWAIHLFQKRAVQNVDLIHATAQSEKENLLKLGWNDNIHVIANGIDVKSINLKSLWQRKNKILFLSRIHPKKGIDILINAVANIRERLADYTIEIVGDGDRSYVEYLKDLASQLKVRHMIRFMGAEFSDAKWNLFKEADLFVLPTYSENFGLVIGEALAAGTPVITTDGTPWQVLETQKCGWWIAKGDVRALEDAIIQFLSLSEEDLETMGRNGRQLVEKKYSAHNIAEQYLEMYQQLLTE
ncbi:MAG: glycosyltransferase [Marinilabiliaceae bacterium]|nr:glycosyltransferase [Marinilabiliaceae bacterium]